MSKKSGDSKLQDAEQSRLNEREGVVAGEDAQKDLPNALQDSPEQAKAAGASADQIRRMEQMLKQLTDVVEQQAKRLSDLSANGGKALTRADLARRVQCGVCGQYASVCAGDHVTLRVLPRDTEYLNLFPGIRINGVPYIGMCVVPRACADYILSAVGQFEWAQKMLNHNKGVVSGWDKDLQQAELLGNMARVGKPTSYVG